MKVADLLELLQGLNKDDHVFVKTGHGIEEVVNVSSSDDADYREIYIETYKE